MRYIDFDFYQYRGGFLKEEQFNSVISRAEDIIDNATANRAFGAAGYKRVRVENAVAALCDELYRQGTMSVEKELSSVSNGDRSESYAVMKPEEKRTALKAIVSDYLSGTGLTGAL